MPLRPMLRHRPDTSSWVVPKHRKRRRYSPYKVYYTGRRNKRKLERQILENVLTMYYTRRDGLTRVMHCTKSKKILNSAIGKRVEGFVVPTGQLPYDITKTNNIIVWDLDKHAWRTINADRVVVTLVIPDIYYYNTTLKSKDNMNRGVYDEDSLTAEEQANLAAFLGW